jgi:hypothetical protein
MTKLLRFLRERIGEPLRSDMEGRTKIESAESCGAAMRLKTFIVVLVLIGHAGRGGSSVWAAAGEMVKDVEAVRLSAEQAQSLVDDGTGVTTLRRFLVFEGSAADAEIPDSDPMPQEACSGDYLYGYSDLDVPIPTGGDWNGSGIILSGLSPDAEVTCIDVHYEINHHYYSALVVELTDEDYDFAHTLYDDYYTGDGDISETVHGITKFNGRSPNQEWVLWVQNGGPLYGGHIDSWWIKVYYYEPFYCSATSTYCSWEHISNVQVGDISNATDCNYYGDYTSMSTAMDVGTGYPITVTNGYGDPADECGIWVDWNQDGDFDDVSETILVSGSPGEGPYIATITPPPTAANGDTRLRIRISDEPAGPCGEYDYGEVEDYTITVTGGAMAQIQGRKFHDINGNGTQDGNEPGLGSWKIYIDANENGQWDSGELYNLTDVNGNYALVDLAAGSYTVAEVLQTDCEQTFPGGDGTHVVVLSPGELAENIDFGNRIPVPYGGGTGTPEDPYLIYTPSQMNAIGANPNDWHSHFKLMADIDLSAYTGTSFNIIGNSSTYFTGVFDGNGHTISNFTYNSTGTDYIGLFGYVSEPNADIRDLGLLDPNVNLPAARDVGALVGYLNDGTVSNCYVEGGCITGLYHIGGLVGKNYGNISNCHTDCNVVSMNYASGGLVGNNHGTIYSSSATGEISSAYNAIGGLVGLNDGEVYECYATATVSGSYGVGGLVGRNYHGKVCYCYASGHVSGSSTNGGLVGSNGILGVIAMSYAAGIVGESASPGGLVGGNEGWVWKCYWDIDATGQTTSAGGEGKSTAEMQTESTFTDAGWDFVDETDNGIKDIWRLCNEGTEYPKLNWQYPSGDFGCPDGVDGIDLGLLCEQWLLGQLSADLWPQGGDGFVDFLDWAIFADGWQITVDYDGLADFAEQWLKEGATIADIAPYGGDGIVNMADFAALADNWLAGI